MLCLSVLSFWAGEIRVKAKIINTIDPIHSISEINQQIPLVTIKGIEDAKILGSVSDPSMRIVSGDQVSLPDDDLRFELNIEHLGYIGQKRAVIEHVIPEGALFVASKTGKYFYPLEAGQAKRLSVPNRVYFSTKEEAFSAGYLEK